MSSKVLYPHTPTTRSLHHNDASASNDLHGSTSSSTRRPRRAAAIASQAATFASSTSFRRKSSLASSKSSAGASTSSSSTLPHTPQQQQQYPLRKNSTPSIQPSELLHSDANIPPTVTTTTRTTSDQQPSRTAYAQTTSTSRPMAALPRAKRARRGELPTENGLVANGTTAAYNAIGSSASSSHTHIPMVSSSTLPNKNSIMMGIDSALNSSHSLASVRSAASSSRSIGLGSSVREMIGGQEREVFVVDSTSPPTSSTNAYGYIGGGGEKGKRKAAGTPAGMGAAGGSASDYAGSTVPTSSKRRRKDVLEQHQDPSFYKPDAVRNLYAGNVAPAMANYSTLASAKPVVPPNALSSYRGGYNAGNTYYKQPRNGIDAYGLQDAYAIAPPPQPELPVDDAEGHFIVREGDQVTERYRILSLLGQGTFGKVVKCKDSKSPRQVAIKIIRAVQKYTDAAQIEIRVLQTLRESDPWNENKCIHLLETFTYRNHVCIVSELLGQSVFDFLKDNEFYPFPPRHIWSFAKQLLRSVAFLHRLGLVHTDLKPENILLVNGSYDLQPLSWRANAKKKRVLHDTDIRLIDFGSATFNEEYHSQVVSTRHYRAPEIILQMGWSFPCDAWSIGCILIEFYTGEALFQTHDNLEHLAMMEAVLGSMPDDFRRKAETYRPNFFRSGRLDFPNSATNRQSRKFVKGMKTLSDTINSPSAYRKHDQRFRHLLERLLTFDPNQRIRVDAALKHPYFDLSEDEIPP